jgi:hypothetical protein
MPPCGEFTAIRRGLRGSRRGARYASSLAEGSGAKTIRQGAYGFHFPGLEAAAGKLVAAPAAWPSVTVSVRRGNPARQSLSVGEDRAVFPVEAGIIVVDRSRREATFEFLEPPTVDELVHPYLAPAAAVFAWWAGYQTFHAAAFLANGGAWALMGEKEAGKSSTVASLALAGHAVICDDLLVLHEGRAFAGPPCADLRADAATWLGAGKRVGVRGPSRERWRLQAPPGDAETPLSGWIILGWGDEAELSPVRPAARLRRLSAYRTFGSKIPDPSIMLDLAALPMWELRRPRRPSSLSGSIELLLKAVRG